MSLSAHLPPCMPAVLAVSTLFRSQHLSCARSNTEPITSGPNSALIVPASLLSHLCSKSEQINSDPNSALGSLPYTAPEVLSNTMKHGHQVGNTRLQVVQRGGSWACRAGQQCSRSAALHRSSSCEAVRSLGITLSPCSCCGIPLLMPWHSLLYITAQADVWSLGVALYKMCVGLYPFERLEDAADARTAVQVRMGGRMLCPLCPL